MSLPPPSLPSGLAYLKNNHCSMFFFNSKWPLFPAQRAQRERSPDDLQKVAPPSFHFLFIFLSSQAILLEILHFKKETAAALSRMSITGSAAGGGALILGRILMNTSDAFVTSGRGELLSFGGEKPDFFRKSSNREKKDEKKSAAILLQCSGSAGIIGRGRRRPHEQRIERWRFERQVSNASS